MTSEPVSISAFERERKRKQEYLKAHILEDNFDPEHFSNFLIQERIDGDQIDNWTYEELETMVALYKRQIRAKQPTLDLYYKLEDLELYDDKTTVYAKRVETARRKATLLSASRQTIKVQKIDVIEGGFFYGKSLAFELMLYPAKTLVIRSEEQFKWLQETISLEFPQCLVPPLTKVISKGYDDETLRLYKYFYETFLNELAAHKDLRHSLALENFLRCRSKEELDIKRNEIEGFIKRNILLERNLTKKKFDGLTQNPLVVYPTPNGKMTLKISQILKKHFVSTAQKLGSYEVIYDRLDKVALEFDKAYKKLLKASDMYKELVLDMQASAAQFNAQKDVRFAPCASEELVFAATANFIDHQSRLMRQAVDGGGGDDRAQHRHRQQVPEGLLLRGPGAHRAEGLHQPRVLPGQAADEREEGGAAGPGRQAVGAGPGPDQAERPDPAAGGGQPGHLAAVHLHGRGVTRRP